MEPSKQKTSLSEYTDLHWLKRKYFSSEDQKIVLQKGDSVTQQDQLNKRLFYVESGQLSGYYKPSNGQEYAVFTTGANMIAGLHSFFSHDHSSYTNLRADMDSIVYYVELEQIPEKGTEDYGVFVQHTMPIVVNEIYHRQMRAIRTTAEKEAAIQKLLDSERMATLGQLASGLAHELNNAISVISGKTDWFTKNLNQYVSEKDSKGFYPYFLKAMQEGQKMSSREIRQLKKEINALTGLDNDEAETLARCGFPKEKWLETKNWPKDYFSRLQYYWDAGLALRDLRVASDHTAHVIQSIRELGAVNRNSEHEFLLEDVIHKAISLLPKELNGIELKLSIPESAWVRGREGDWLQVFLNLIKNAAEALKEDKIQSPRIEIEALKEGDSLKMKVIDNGSGISPEMIDKIFQPSFTTKVKGLSFGLGLGLSIVQKIISDYKGSMRVSSAPGKTCFFISLPNI